MQYVLNNSCESTKLGNFAGINFCELGFLSKFVTTQMLLDSAESSMPLFPSSIIKKGYN